jgi:farnesyl diphosphate synthase
VRDSLRRAGTDTLATSDWAAVSRQQIEEFLSRALAGRVPQGQRGDRRLADGMSYALLGGGKRIRALLAMAAGQAVSAPPAYALVAGAALESIHAFSLVHDDMPCMDDDELRRGRPTVHVAFGEAQALLVGDALQTLGFELIADMDAPDDIRVRLIRILARGTGALGMAGGQAIDIDALGQTMTQTELEAMHAMKTGALISAAVAMGAACGRAPSTVCAALDRFAARIGLAFQVVDDVLDVSADAATLGKTPGKDAAANKPTFVALLGVDGAQRYARRLHEEALEALAPLEDTTAELRRLAAALVERTH